MGIQIYPTVPVEGQGAQPAAEPWPVDEHTIRTQSRLRSKGEAAGECICGDSYQQR